MNLKSTNKFKKAYFSDEWMGILPKNNEGYLKIDYIKLIRNASITLRYISDISEEFDKLVGETSNHLFIPTKNPLRYKLNPNFDWDKYLST